MAVNRSASRRVLEQPRMNIGHEPSDLLNRRIHSHLFALQFLRHFPAGINAFHVGQIVSDPLMAIDAGSLSGQEILRVNIGSSLCLLLQVHSDRRMAVAAFQAVIGFHPSPFVLRKCQAMFERLRTGVDRAEDFSPHFLRCLHLPRNLVGPVVRHEAIETSPRVRNPSPTAGLS